MSEGTEATPNITIERGEWQDLIAVKAIAAGCQEKFHSLVDDISRGRVKNTVWIRGYIQCLRDLHQTLTTITDAPADTQGEENDGKD